MWLSIWKAAVAFLAFIGALVFLLFGTLVVLAVLQATGERPAGQPEPVENLQYLVAGCGLQHLKIATIDKRHESSYNDNQNGSHVNPGTGHLARAYALTLIKHDAQEPSISFPDQDSNWHQSRNISLPYLHRNAFNVYFENIDRAKVIEWLPSEKQLASADYLLKVSNISFDNAIVSHAAICIFRPADNRLYVVNFDNW